MAPCDIIAVEKERWTRWADSEGVLLITVDFSDNATLFVYYIKQLKVMGIKKRASLAWSSFIDGVALDLFVTSYWSLMGTFMSRLGVTCMYRLYSLHLYVT